MTEADFDRPELADRLLRKAETAIRGRTSRILCVIERCTDEHNYSAVIRTCEALGVQHIWLVDPVEVSYDGLVDDDDVHDDTDDDDAHEGGDRGHNKAAMLKSHGHGSAWREAHKLFARRANEFTSIREFQTTAACVDALREAGYAIWATDLSQKAVAMTHDALRDAGYGDPNDPAVTVVPEKLAIVFGTESVGCTEEILQAADSRVYLPLRGFADSLNLSVAAALVMHELFHLCPEAVGATAPAERDALRAKWFTQLAAARALSGAEEKRRSWIERTLAKRGDAANSQETRAPGGAAEPTTVLNPSPKASDDASLARELEALLEKRASLARAAAAPHVANPPKPLRDMRRSDEHREAFVGHRTRMRNAEHWAGMPAMGGTGTEAGPP